MIIEFYLANGECFLREIPQPLPPRYYIDIHKHIMSGPIKEKDSPPIPTVDYLEFELATIRYTYHPLSNVVGLPRKAYKEIKR